MSSLRNSYDRLVKDDTRIYSQLVTIDGTPTGSDDINVNGSVTPVDFWVQPAPDEVLYVRHVSISISDNGNPSYNGYGNISGPLANGSILFYEQNGVEKFASKAFNENDDFIESSDSYDVVTFSNNVNVTIYREHYDEYSQGIRLNGATNDKFGFRVRDNLSTLLEHKCRIKGHILKASF